MVKNLDAVQEIQVRSLGREDPLEREWLPTLVFLPGEFHGQRILVSYSSWGRKESETAQQLTHAVQFKCSCLYGLASGSTTGSGIRIETHGAGSLSE